EGGELDFFEQVDADESVVSFLGEEDLDEAGGDVEFHGLAAGSGSGQGGRVVGSAGEFAALHKVLGKEAFGDGRDRKGGEGAADGSVGVAGLEAPGEDRGNQGAGDNAELSGQGDRPGQFPVGNGDAHAALDDDGMSHEDANRA